MQSLTIWAWKGGGVYASSFNHIVMRNSTVSNNVAVGLGGGFLLLEHAVLNSHYCQWVGNEAGRNGGALAAVSATAEAYSDSFLQNTAMYVLSLSICVSVSLPDFDWPVHCHLSWLKLNLIRCDADLRNGGAVHVDSEARMNFSGALFRGNRADGSGGALRLEAAARSVVQNSSFEHNFALVRGGALSAGTDAAALFWRCVMDGNVGVRGGGALEAESTAVVQMLICRLRDNSAASGCGGALLLESFASATLLQCELLRNRVTTGLSLPRNLEQASRLEEGDSESRGGALCLTTSARVLGAELLLAGNSAGRGGGAFVGVGASLICGAAAPALSSHGGGGSRVGQARLAGSCRFVGNKGVIEGGGLSMEWGASVQLRGSAFRRNRAGAHGGAVYVPPLP